VLGQQREQPADALQTLRQAGLGQPPTRLVLDLDVVVRSAWSAVPGLLPARFSMPPSRTGRASCPRIRLSTRLIGRAPRSSAAAATGMESSCP
jgi:hypothetical protein